LEENPIACQKKLKEHHCQTLWARQVFASQRPAMDFVPGPGDEGVGVTIEPKRKNKLRVNMSSFNPLNQSQHEKINFLHFEGPYHL
jgi:hypothetical protein